MAVRDRYDAVLAWLDRNLALARELEQEIMAEAGRSGTAASSHLSEVFAAMRSSSPTAMPPSSPTAMPPSSPTAMPPSSPTAMPPSNPA